jgi:hypothetical protein
VIIKSRLVRHSVLRAETFQRSSKPAEGIRSQILFSGIARAVDENRENRPQQPEALKGLIGQATKGSRWIPWHTEAMKDVVTCDKSRGAGNTL